ncbi:MAG: tRNA pseudouridine(54/55) synthase Pus10 [archaeon]|nr:tRNA pseudouridine(54/55) synthase Pus10 [archaeon]
MEQWVSDNLDKAAILAERGYCDHCLGRMFAKCGEQLTDLQRGEMLREALAEQGKEYEPEEICPLCEDVFSMLPRFAEAVAEKVLTVESDNFLIGCRVDPSQAKTEKETVEELGLGETFEPLKTELNREIGKIALPLINRAVNFKEPQVVACIDTRFADVTLDIAPMFIAGRYLKLSREVPQTKWPCRICRGKGCPRCHGTGKMYQCSVQECIGDVALEMAGGDEHFFHGMGREDIDARMLGTGRPFILEISHPRVRNIDLEELARRINDSPLAQFRDLRFVHRKYVKEYKEAEADKLYRAKVKAEGKVNKDKLVDALLSFENVNLDQRTPQRVEHRRADLVRNRTVYWVKAENIEEDTFDLILKTQSGTYVKEFVSGDEGRTTPNFSDAIGVQCYVELLDVLEIDYQQPED